MRVKKAKEIKTPYASFPSHSEPETTKRSDDFGLQVGKAIEYEWFNGPGSQNSFFSRWNDFHRKRLYARAEQPEGKYKREMAALGDLSYLNLDWKNVPIMPKFIDIIVNGMSDRVLKPRVEAIDPMSQSERNQFQKDVEGQMAAKDLLMKVQDNFKVDPFTVNPEDLPATSDELELYMQLNYKPSIEIAQEISIQTILEENKYLDIKKRMDYDQVVLGVSFCEDNFMPGSGINIEYRDPAHVLHSRTNDPAFRDCFYWGYVESIPITELHKINPDIKEDQLEEIKRTSTAWYDYHGLNQYYSDPMMRENSVTIFRFSYLTTMKLKYKKTIKNGRTMSIKEKDYDWDPSDDQIKKAGDYEVVEKEFNVWYDGIKIAGTDIILKWEPQENMVRPKTASQKALPRYHGYAPRMYNGRIDSLAGRMIQFADLIQLTHLKLQQVVAKTVPDGVYIDADGLTNVDLGNGSAYNPGEALKLYLQTGSVVGRSKDIDDEYNHGRIPIQELGSNSGASKIQSLIGNYNHYLSMMSNVAGLNQATDGSTPDERALVGVNKLAALNSNTATRHVIDASVNIYQSVCEAVSLRFCDVIKFSEEFKEEFINKIGQSNYDVIDSLNGLHLRSFGIFVEIAPDANEREALERNIEKALDRGDIFLEDAIDIRELNNIKLANQLLKLKRVKKQKREERMAQEKDARANQMNLAQIEKSAEADKIKQTNKAKAEVFVIKEKTKADIQRMKEEKEAKKELMDLEFRYNMRLKGIEVKGKELIESEKEDRKDKRQDKIASQQSAMIEQRKKESSPINFESNEDSLDGFDLGSFEPK